MPNNNNYGNATFILFYKNNITTIFLENREEVGPYNIKLKGKIYWRNPTLKECEDDIHTPEMGTWESSGTPENSKFDCRGQNTSP
jgi:hypothetical protein